MPDESGQVGKLQLRRMSCRGNGVTLLPLLHTAMIKGPRKTGRQYGGERGRRCTQCRNDFNRTNSLVSRTRALRENSPSSFSRIHSAPDELQRACRGNSSKCQISPSKSPSVLSFYVYVYSPTRDISPRFCLSAVSLFPVSFVLFRFQPRSRPRFVRNFQSGLVPNVSLGTSHYSRVLSVEALISHQQICNRSSKSICFGLISKLRRITF